MYQKFLLLRIESKNARKHKTIKSILKSSPQKFIKFNSKYSNIHQNENGKSIKTKHVEYFEK
jgi:hypothetical protein